MVSRMLIISISIPRWQHTIIQKMKTEDLIVSISEYIRKALDNQLSKDYLLIKNVVEDGEIIKMIEVCEPEVLETPCTISINGRVWQKQ